MAYEDMVHEQEERTWFDITDHYSGVETKLSLRSTNDELWPSSPDCIEITTDDTCIAIAPGDALHILEWLTYHKARLETARGRDRIRLLSQ